MKGGYFKHSQIRSFPANLISKATVDKLEFFSDSCLSIKNSLVWNKITTFSYPTSRPNIACASVPVSVISFACASDLTMVVAFHSSLCEPFWCACSYTCFFSCHRQRYPPLSGHYCHSPACYLFFKVLCSFSNGLSQSLNVHQSDEQTLSVWVIQLPYGTDYVQN